MTFKTEPVWDGGLSWKQMRKGKDWYDLSLLFKERGGREEEGKETEGQRGS